MCRSPNSLLSINSMSQTLPFWSGDSWVMMGIPAALARSNTGSSAFASFGTTPIALTFLAMRSSTARTCWAGSAVVGPTM